MLKLYDYFRSSACYRVRIALNLKNLPYETIPIHLVNNGGEQHSDDYTKVNPASLVPTLNVDGQVITQSIAIMEYLNEIYPNPALLPSDPLLRAKSRAFALTITSDIHPLNNLRVVTFLTNDLGISEENKKRWYHHWLHKGLSALEATLHQREKKYLFCFSDTPSLADICLVPQLYNARRFHCDLTNYKTLLTIDSECQKLKAFADAFPKEVPA